MLCVARSCTGVLEPDAGAECVSWLELTAGEAEEEELDASDDGSGDVDRERDGFCSGSRWLRRCLCFFFFFFCFAFSCSLFVGASDTIMTGTMHNYDKKVEKKKRLAKKRKKKKT